MSDGRAFGLAPYLQPGDRDAHVMNFFGVTDNAAYRQVLYTRGADITRRLFEESYEAMSPVDQGCVAPAPAKPPMPPVNPAA